MPSILEIEELQRIVDDRGLSTPAMYRTPLTAEQIREIYNGIGPSALPGCIRGMITSTFHHFAAAAMIHDIRFAYALGSEYDFHDANHEFRENCERLLNSGTRWWQWLLRRARRKEADALYYAVETDDGYRAYIEAYNQKSTRK